MIAVPKDDLRLLLDLVSVGAVAVATIGFFFGAAFLLLSPPRPAAPPADPVSPIQALEAHEVPQPGNNDTAWGSLSAAPAEKVAASPTAGAPPNREAPALEATELEVALLPPAGITHQKKVGIGPRRRQGIGRHWAAFWRPDASAGPNPGGGFYGPPNINVGRINPPLR